MNGLNYLIQTNLYLLLFMGFYVLVLRNETFFRQNRLYLNISIFLSFAIPFINSEWFRDLFITQRVHEAAIRPTMLMYDTVVVGAGDEVSALTIPEIMFLIYASGAVFLLMRLIIRVILLSTNLQVRSGAAFSFFNRMIVDQQLPQAETIMDHEKVHIRQWHSADIIFIELAAVVNWFNPVMYLYKKEIRHIHEFIADEEASASMQSKSDYALLLFSHTVGVDPDQLKNNFFNKSLLKRRIIMLHKNKSRSIALWKYGFSAPLFVLMLIVSAATVRSEEVIIRPVAERILSPLPQEASSSILSAMDLEQESSTDKPSSTQATSDGPASYKLDQAAPDYTALKKHLMRNIRYPASARENNITGTAVVNFAVKGKKIRDIKIEKSIHGEIDADIIRTLSLFSNDLDVADDRYLLAIKYNLMGGDTQVTDVGDLEGKNFVGQIIVTAMAKPGESRAVVPDGDNNIKDFASIEVQPEFLGGMEGWVQYLSANLKYPKEAREKKITGRVILGFIVEKDGSISNIKLLRGIGGGADEEAMRVLQLSPSWKPGIQNSRPVRVAYTMPIFFQLAETSGDKQTQEIKPEN